MDILGGFTGLIDKLLWRNDDDVYDRLNHRWTPGLLAGFALLVSTTQYVGDPIHCWVPVHFTGAWESYTDSFCWIRNTYWLPIEDEIPKDYASREKHPIIYYQWVPLILMVQALLFYLPILIWRGMNSKTGIDLNDIVETAEKFQFSDDLETKNKVLFFLTKQTHRYLGLAKRPPRKGIFKNCGPRIQGCFAKLLTPCCGARFGNYITSVYLIVKLIMLANCIGQLFLLNKFLGFDYHLYGVYVVQAMISGTEWSESPRFPRVTLCDFDIRRLGNVHRYTVQCVLTINLFNEMIYLVIWFWLVFVALVSVIGILLLLTRMIYKPDRTMYVEKHLVVDDVYNPESQRDKKLLEKFVNEYLRQDGVLMLRLVGHNTNKVVINEFVCALFKMYKNLPRVNKAIEDEMEPEEVRLNSPSATSDNL